MLLGPLLFSNAVFTCPWVSSYNTQQATVPQRMQRYDEGGSGQHDSIHQVLKLPGKAAWPKGLTG